MAIPIDLSTEPLQEPVASCDTATSCLARLSMQNGGAARITAARKRIDLASEPLPLSRLVKLAAEFGLQAEWIQLDWQGLKTAVVAHPVLIVRKNTDVVVVTGGGRSGAEEVSVWDPHHDGVVFFVAREDFEGGWSGHALIITPEDEGANTSPTPPDMPKQQTPRAARASKLSRHARTSRRSLGLTLGLAATAIVVSASIAVFLLTPPSADQVAGPSAPARVDSAGAQNTLVNRREAAPSTGVLATTPEAISIFATPTSTGPTPIPTPDGAPRLGAPTREASPAAPPSEDR